MDYTTSSGTLSLKKVGNYYGVFEVLGFLSNTLLGLKAEYFSDLQFLAKCLDYDESKLSKGATLKTNNIFITHTVTDKYSIGTEYANSVELSKEKMSDLMKCLMSSEKWEEDNLALSYGLEEDDAYNGTIRDGKHFPKYIPSIREKYFGLAIENDDQVRIYFLSSSGYWTSIFKVENIDEMEHIERAFLMLQDSMNWQTPIKIVSHCGVINYDPREYQDAEITIGNKKQCLNKEDVSEIIRVINMI